MSPKKAKQNREYKPIHDAVLERDGGCVAAWAAFLFVQGAENAPDPYWPEVRCGGSLVVHHVISRARAPELALEPSNLITLCWDHHTAVHANVALATERGLIRSAGAPCPEAPR